MVPVPVSYVLAVVLISCVVVSLFGFLVGKMFNLDGTEEDDDENTEIVSKEDLSDLENRLIEELKSIKELLVQLSVDNKNKK